MKHGKVQSPEYNQTANLVNIAALTPENGKAIGWQSGAPANLTLFDPANPGAIGTTTPSTGDFTQVSVASGSNVFRMKAIGDNLFINDVAPTGITGVWNTGIGKSCLSSATAAFYNTSIGVQGLNYLTTGSWNTQVGVNNLFALTTGTFNFAAGSSNLFALTTGSYNFTAGSYNFYAATSGYYNAIYGLNGLGSAGAGNGNTVFGVNCLYNASAAYQSIAIGYEAGLQETGAVESKLFIAGNSDTIPTIYGELDKRNIGIGFRDFQSFEKSFGIGNRSGAFTNSPASGGIISVDSGKPRYCGTGISDRSIVLSPAIEPIRLASSTRATLPTASAHTNGIQAVSDGVDGDLYYSNGSAWLEIPRSRSPIRPGRRLALLSGVPVSIADTTSSTIFYTAYEDDAIPLWDGSMWRIWRGGELSLTLSGLTANTNYAVFVHWNGGSPQLQIDAWFSDTLRRSLIDPTPQIVRRDGVWVRQSNNALHVGDFRSISTTQTVSDGTRSFVSNRYNRVRKALKRIESTVSWNPLVTGNAPWGNRSGATTGGLLNRLEILNCENLDPVSATFNPRAVIPARQAIAMGFAIDSIGSFTAPWAGASAITVSNTYPVSIEEPLGLGYHYLQAMASCSATTVTFGGNNECGIIGSHYC